MMEKMEMVIKGRKITVETSFTDIYITITISTIFAAVVGVEAEVRVAAALLLLPLLLVSLPLAPLAPLALPQVPWLVDEAVSGAKGRARSSPLSGKTAAVLALALATAPVALAQGTCSTDYGPIDANGHLDVTNGTTTIANPSGSANTGPFYYCTALKSITFPASLTTIDKCKLVFV